MARKLFMLSEKQMELISPYLPKPRGNPRADDRLVLGGIIFMRRTGIPRDLAPPEHGNPNTLYKRFVRWTRGGVFDRALAGLSAAKVGTAMIDSARCKTRRTAASLKAGPVPGTNDDELPEGRKRKIGMTKGGRNTKVHALCDGKGRPTFILLTAGNVNDCTVATSLIDRMPARAKTFLADKGCDTDEIREELKKRKVEARIPSKATGRSRFRMTRQNTREDRKSRGCSGGSRTGGASPCATTDAMTCSWARSFSRPYSFSGCERFNVHRP